MNRIACLSLFGLALVAQAPQGSKIDTTEMDLLNLLNTPITVASQ